MTYKSDKKYFFIILATIAIDQLSKIWITQQHWQQWRLLSWLNVYVTQNTGIAFGMANHYPATHPLLIAFIILLLGYCLYVIQTQPNTFTLSTILIFAGGMSNLIDRVYHGHVIDFIQIHYADWYFPVFNIADITITFGALILFISIYKNNIK